MKLSDDSAGRWYDPDALRWMTDTFDRLWPTVRRDLPRSCSEDEAQRRLAVAILDFAAQVGTRRKSASAKSHGARET